MSKAERNRQRAKERIAQAKAAEARRKRRQLWLGIGAVVVVVAAAATGIALAVSGGSGTQAASPSSPHLKLAPIATLGTLKTAPSAGPTGPEGVPIPAASPLADTANKSTGGKVDGISCQTNEQTIFHIHAHLTVFVNGVARQIPAGIGIPGAKAQNTPQGQFIDSGDCFYWLHTHAADGIIHIESPIHRIYTLGDFFDEWGQPLGPSQVGPVKGHVTVIYNGKAYKGNPRDIPLNAHAQIQLEIGTPLVSPISITWPSGL